MACSGPSCNGCVTVDMPDGQFTTVCANKRLTIFCTVRYVGPKKNCPGVRGGPEKPPVNRPTPPKPRKEVPPQKPRGETPAEKRKRIKAEKEAEKPRKQRPTTGTQRPGGRGQKKPCVRTVPAPPKVSGKPRSRPLGVTPGVLLMLALGLALVMPMLVAVLKIVVIVAVVLGVAAVATVVAREVPNWWYLPVWLERRRQARTALATQRAQWQTLVEADSAPIALGPIAGPEPVETVTAAEHDALARAWMPGTHVPELAPEWRRGR